MSQMRICLQDKKNLQKRNFPRQKKEIPRPNSLPSYPTTFGCLNREEIGHENVPPRGKSAPNPVWDRGIGHANHS